MRKENMDFRQSTDSGSFEQGFRSMALQKAIENGEVQFDPAKLTLKIEDYNDNMKNAGPMVFSIFSPTLLIDAFKEFCNIDKIAFELNEKKYKIKFTKQGTTSENVNFIIKATMKIYKVNEEEVAV
jgi:hypothetical protein